MSDNIKHECGIALIRLRKPLEYYSGKYGSVFYGLEKLHLLMQKQHNRGQDGAGLAVVKMDAEPGKRYIRRIRSNSGSPIIDIFNEIYSALRKLQEKDPSLLKDARWVKDNFDFMGELFLGHLRYGTFGKNNVSNLHPVLRENNWKTRNLVLAGNFNMTNVDELFNKLVDYGQFPVETSDTITILEKIGHFLDESNEKLYRSYKKEGFSKKEISEKIAENLNIRHILKKSSEHWDGGYTIAGLLGHGDAFVLRDPHGIRPAFYYSDEEIVAAASERSVLQTAFNLEVDQVMELKPGFALIIRKNTDPIEQMIRKPGKKSSCSFERIYFSRGNDRDIYHERKNLGRLLAPAVLKAVDYDLENTVFSYIPNTAAVAFQGLVEELNSFSHQLIKDKILANSGNLTPDMLDTVFSTGIRTETIAVKDVKLRTFISQDAGRDELVGHVYDVTYGVVRKNTDQLVVIDDSIVRGTTLKHSIIRILDRLKPKTIVIASSAPQIRYPDCYGIDMAKLSDFIAFRAAIELLKTSKQDYIINEVYKKCKEQETFPKEEMANHVKEIYRPFSAEQISEKIATMLTRHDTSAKIKIIYQSIEDLHLAIPGHPGDWYFTGNYPTPGGNKVVNRSFINYIEGKNERAY
ncbi:MAG: amidophosphoribosyltransferase [Bacteroidales bacterium]|nr:amidophosphoribosyltransferase [Bacteroidales bacterium]